MEHLTCVFSNFSKQFNVFQLYFFQNLKKKVENSEICFYLFFSNRYVTSFETGNQPVTDIFHFVVYDGENNRLENQMFTITITSTQRQPPVVTVRSGIKVTIVLTLI